MNLILYVKVINGKKFNNKIRYFDKDEVFFQINLPLVPDATEKALNS